MSQNRGRFRKPKVVASAHTRTVLHRQQPRLCCNFFPVPHRSFISCALDCIWTIAFGTVCAHTCTLYTLCSETASWRRRHRLILARQADWRRCCRREQRYCSSCRRDTPLYRASARSVRYTRKLWSAYEIR